MIYMDHNATTPLDPRVLEAMMPYMQGDYGNASSIHALGKEARDAVEKARGQVAALIGAHPKEIIFTSGGTEADNLAIVGTALEHVSDSSRDPGYIITSQIEHKAVLAACRSLPRDVMPTLYAPISRTGTVDPDQIKIATKAMDRSLVLISVMDANNEIGTIQPVQAISEIARDRHALMHTDAVQSLGKIPVNVDNLGVDLLSMSAHKIYGPKGVGALYVRHGTKLTPQIVGGHQEKYMRAGTENVAGVVGFGKAAEIAARRMEDASRALFLLTRKLWYRIQNAIPDVHINGDPENGLPNTINLSFLGVYNEALLLLLDAEGFAASSGAACTSGSLQPSHVLQAMGCDALACDGAVRFSLGRQNRLQDVEALLAILPGIVRELRAVRGAQIERVAKGLGDMEVSHGLKKEELRGPGAAD